MQTEGLAACHHQRTLPKAGPKPKPGCTPEPQGLLLGKQQTRKPRFRKMKGLVQSHSTQLVNRRSAFEGRPVRSKSYAQEKDQAGHISGNSNDSTSLPHFTKMSLKIRPLICIVAVDTALAAGFGRWWGRASSVTIHTCSPPMLTSSSVPLGLKVT